MKPEKKVEKVGEEIKVYEIDEFLDMLSFKNATELYERIRYKWDMDIDVIWLKK